MGRKWKQSFFDEHQPDHISKLMQHFVAGQLHCLPHILPMLRQQQIATIDMLKARGRQHLLVGVLKTELRAACYQP